jgi:cytoskeleton protein RodZ
METLGVWLRQTREAQGSTLEEVEDATRIRPRFLEALEAGDLSTFSGGEVQVRGFLRIYARYLGLSADEVLARYDREIHGVEAVSPTAPAESSAPPSRLIPEPVPLQPSKSSFSTASPRAMNLITLVIGSIAVVVLLAMIIVGGYSLIRNAAQEATPASTAAATTITGTEVPAAATPATTPTFPVNPQGEVTLSLEAAEHVWVRVIQDDFVVFSGMMETGQIETWTGQQLVKVETGNGAGLLVTVNGQPQGAMCGRAEVCSRAWGAIGEVILP